MQTSNDMTALVGSSLCKLVDDSYKFLLDAGIECEIGIDKPHEYIRREKAIIWLHLADGVSALRFATELLPGLGKAFDKALATDEPFDYSVYKTLGLECSINPQGAPWRFLGKLIDFVFTPKMQEIPNGSSARLVMAIRQICYLMYKYQLPFTKAQIAKASDTFVENDTLCGSVAPWYEDGKEEIKGGSKPNSLLPGLRVSNVLHVMKNITGKIFNRFDPWDIVPCHGPGAVSTGERGVQKLQTGFRHMPELLKTYDITYFTSMPNGMFDLLDRSKCNHGSVPQEPTTKVVFVPKDSRGPRVISSEPLDYMFIQQGLGRAIAAHLESHAFVSGRINFTYQDINRDIALRSSISGDYVTLDLKDASDLVRSDLVYELFEQVPDLRRCIFAARSTSTRLPSGRVVALKKFAPMGSALCFPVESFVFWVICVATIHLSTGLSLSAAARCVYVYGDDIACLSAYHRLIGAYLEQFGLKLNRSKCCYGRFFRESCGMDAYKGVNVSPARWKKPIPSNHRDVSSLFSLAALSNGLYERGFETTADYFADMLYKIEPLTLRLTRPMSGLLAIIRPYHTDALNLTKRRKRYNRKLQIVELLGVVASPLTYEYSGGGWCQVSNGIINLHRSDMNYLDDEDFVRECGTVTSYPFATRVRYNVAWRPFR